MQERRERITDPAVLDALAHPLRLDLLGYLAASGPATASECARAVGDSPSNCSYHLRVLAAHGLVESEAAADGRTRPWRATVTGFTVGKDDGQGVTRMLAASVELDHHLVREHLRRREELTPAWRETDEYAAYGLALTPDELAAVLGRIDEIVRPYLQATREDAPAAAEHVHLSLVAFPRLGFEPGAQDR